MGDERSLEAVERVLGRYGEVVDGEAFARASTTSLPPVLWAHPRRIERDALFGELPGAEEVAWTDDGLRWPVERPGRHWAHAAGLFHVQEEASRLPVRMLDVQPGQRVLDLCAAPGGKTARIALALRGRGTVVANDRKAGRHAGTSATIARLGLANVVTTVADGTTFEDDLGFDRILVDAPCTAEGNLSGRLRRQPVDAGYRRFITEVQTALLTRAVALCRPGGRVVYATCTYAPEENEAVVEGVLGPDVRLVAVETGGLAAAPGLTSFGHRAFDPQLGRARRLWPHLSGTGGFFAAALDKASADSTVAPAGVGAGDDGWAPLADRYGLPPLEELRLSVRPDGDALRLVSPPLVAPTAIASAAVGLCMVRRRGRSQKLTTEAAMRLGRQATRNLVQLDPEQVVAYQARQPLRMRPDQCRHCEGGYVIVRYGPYALGMAMLRGRALASEFPKAWAWDPSRLPDGPRR